MQTHGWWWAAALLIAAGAAGGQDVRVDPERLLTERFGFTSAEVAGARQGQAVAKVKVDGDELTVVGAIRLSGKKERLGDWLKNIEHFRTSAELGATHLIQTPMALEAFAGVTLDSADLEELKRCTPEKCAIRLPSNVLAQLQRDGVSKANEIVRQMLFDYARAYQTRGNAAVSPDMHGLIAKAKTLTDLAPQFVAFLDGYPAAEAAGVDQRFYWASMPAGETAIVSLHHLVQYRPRAGEIWIADKNLYASRYFDAGITAIGLYDTPDGAGFYAVAGGRIKASQLGGVAGTMLRRQIQRSASDTIRMYLEWIRDSLAQSGPAAR